jgi:hypothetical protein
MDTSTGAFTVSVVLPETLPELAVIIAGPAPTVVAKPAAFIVATLVAEEPHVTVDVTFCVLLLV